MKLRLRGNSLRLRVNQKDVADLASGRTLAETLVFPAGAEFRYTLAVGESSIEASAQLVASTISVTLPEEKVRRWATEEDVGIYFELPAGDTVLKVAIEKDLECLGAPAEERDPLAYPRE